MAFIIVALGVCAYLPDDRLRLEEVKMRDEDAKTRAALDFAEAELAQDEREQNMLEAKANRVQAHRAHVA